ncbi:hypothetical protein EA472_01885 [Natrarchaeobius oligotrophus]|uniref:Uncharacterized protein n=1 Tax=Natrarchaeobius chitinivorans TaxID=1679083 RepID=A0A3N6PP60_NATCH|nr:hypothetical protein EA472_01885 [Natrarchaeobius chitinivorans]
MLVFVVVGSLFVLPLSVDQTDGPVEMGSSETFVSSGEIWVDSDELLVKHNVTVLEENEAHGTFETSNGTIETVSANGTIYKKYETSIDDKDWVEQREPTDAEKVHFGQHQDRVVMITKENRTQTDPLGMQFIFDQIRYLATLPEYDRVDEEADRVVYEPTSAWTEDAAGEMIHVTPEAGELSVDTETGVLREASLQYEGTDVSSYGEYLLRTGESAEIRVEYEYEPDTDVEDIEAPDWVTECVKNDRCEF